MILKQAQRVGHCGPCSLSYGMFLLLGKDIDQSKVVSAVYPVTGYMRVALGGMEPLELHKAAAKFGVRTDLIGAPEKHFQSFYRSVYGAVQAGFPAIMCVNWGDCGHWICLAGVIGKNFIVCDPDSDEVFSIWTKADLEEETIEADEEDTFEGPGYFAILLSRKDRRPPAFRMSKGFMKLVEEESYDDLKSMRTDLEVMADRLGKGRTPLALHLVRLKSRVLSALDHIDWDSAEADKREMAAFYDDYVIVASSAGLATKPEIDDATLAAEMAVLMSTCAWWGEL